MIEPLYRNTTLMSANGIFSFPILLRTYSISCLKSLRLIILALYTFKPSIKLNPLHKLSTHCLPQPPMTSLKVKSSVAYTHTTFSILGNLFSILWQRCLWETCSQKSNPNCSPGLEWNCISQFPALASRISKVHFTPL